MLCVNCGRELTERGCKVRCGHCGYFEDCSDPSAPGEWLREEHIADARDPRAKESRAPEEERSG